MGLLDRIFGRRKHVDTSPQADSPVFTVFDVETTGFSPRTDRVIEIALVRTDAFGQLMDSWVSRFNPDRPVGATHTHGISDQDVASAPRFHDEASTIATAMQGTTLVAHNAAFDVAFLRREFELAGWELPALQTYCTLEASSYYLPHLARRRLPDCCDAAGVPLHRAHSALGDATATAHLLHSYLVSEQSIQQAPSWSPVHAALTPPTSPEWPTRPSRVRRQPEAPAGSSATYYRNSAKTSHIADALSDTRGHIQIGGDHPPATAAYIELLLEALQDGALSAGESSELEQLTRAQGVTGDDVHGVHRGLIASLAQLVVDTGRVPRNERHELISVAAQLGIGEKEAVKALEEAEESRTARLDAATVPLPAGWQHGEPLRVADRVAFTGDDGRRTRQETESATRGLRVTGSVSRLTSLLVWDGSMRGTKLRAAEKAAVRIVSPAEYEALLQHVQPSRDGASGNRSASTTKEPVKTAPGNSSHAPSARSEPPSNEGSASPENPAPASSTAPPSRDLKPADIRAWARQNGITVAERGRLSAGLTARYRAAQADQNVR